MELPIISGLHKPGHSLPGGEGRHTHGTARDTDSLLVRAPGLARVLLVMMTTLPLLSLPAEADRQIVLGFLHRMSQAWKDKHIAWFVAESPVWSGAPL